MVHGEFAGVGMGANSILVALLPGRELLAARLTNRFGDQLELTVGATPYCGEPGISPPCPTLTGSDELPAGLRLDLRLDRPEIRRTETLEGELTIRYDGPDLFQMDPGQPIVAFVVQPQTRTIVSILSGALAGTGLGLNLRSGEQAPIKVIVGTSLCGGSVGSTLAPGDYGVRAGIGANEGPPQYLAPEVSLAVTNDEP